MSTLRETLEQADREGYYYAGLAGSLVPIIEDLVAAPRVLHQDGSASVRTSSRNLARLEEVLEYHRERRRGVEKKGGPDA